MTLITMLMLAASALIIGCLIGCVGVGGVLLPPALLYIGGFDLHLAMATSIWSFLFTGIAGTITYSRRRSIDGKTALWLGAGVIPAAVLGARGNAALPVDSLTILLATLIIVTGISNLQRLPTGECQARSLGVFFLFAVGAIVGFGSALTGTGGPILLVPILVLMRVPILEAVGTSQVIQIPVAAFGTVGYIVYGQVDFVIGTTLGVIEVAGVVIGTHIAHAAPTLVLHRIVLATCVGVGILMIVHSI